MASNTIDLNRKERQRYQPRTLNQHNSARYNYLPTFPTKYSTLYEHLLLANVPVTRLTPYEIARRQHGAYTSDALMLMNNYNYSNNDGFNLFQQDAEELAVRLRIGMSIITFNADRLRGICFFFLKLHELFRRNNLYINDLALKEPVLNSKQMAMALEFYLQMDVDIFYMKTCSFRGAEPRSNIEGLFCEKHEPEARYTMVSCGNLSCSCCHPPNSLKKSQPWPVVDFVSSSMHQFVNGYTTYLNCPATCNTSNVIYTMTCPCGEYDYVDSTAETLPDAMAYHRKHGNRIIHEKLTGSRLFPGMRFDSIEREREMTQQMRLYQHSARCPVALRTFLDCNPIYWCFIPLLWHEAQNENMTSSKVVSESANMPVVCAVDNRRLADCLVQVPLTPAAYTFSYRQRQKQKLFFEAFLLSSVDELPYSIVDLYKVAIITVLPDDRSIILRYIIETLFIVHGETKLNMICPIGGDPQQRYGRPYDLVWCANLQHPSM